MFEIERGLPVASVSGGREPKYPLANLAVGDSFAVPVTDEEPISQVAYRCYFAVQAYRKRYPETRFAVRRLPDEGVVRVWRVA